MRILTVVSNFNEQEAIGKTIKDIRENATIETDILVIDNCSSDHSLRIIKKSGINYLKHPVNTGGSAGVLKTAFAYAHYHSYDIYCHMDGDNQHLAAELHKIVEPVIQGQADVVTGSRFINKKGFQSSFMRRQGIYLFSRLLSVFTKRKYTDFTSGFRAYNRKTIDYFALKFKQEIESVVQLELVIHYAGLKGIDVPVLMNPRTSGKSEFNLVNTIKFPVYNFISFVGTVVQKYK